MERFLFKQVSAWLVVFLLLIGVIVTVFFGAVVRNTAMGYDRFGWIGNLAYAIASVPATVEDLLSFKPLNRMTVSHSDRFEGRSGWTFDRSDPTALPPGYLLFSRYDGAAGHHVVELLDLQSGEVEHRIDFDADELFEGARRDSEITKFQSWNTARFRAMHPFPLPNGDLIIKDDSTPLWRTDACGRSVWRQEEDLFHHSTEAGLDGTIWTLTNIEPTAVEGLSPQFFDNAFVQMTTDGEILYERSLTEVMLKAGLGYLLFSNVRLDPDPMHLNDVEPVLADGPYWRAGDVFLSLRHLSMVMLFRPSTDEIVWMKQGPWSGQHDVDIIDDHTIGLFNNNMQNRDKDQFVDGNSEILFYDFATGEVTSPFKRQFEEHEIRTETQGLFTLLPSGHLLVEEADAGRFLIFAPDGRLVGENVNRAPDGWIYHQGWSRYLSREEGDEVLAGMRQQDC